MPELKELSVDELLRLKEKLVDEVEELKTWLKQMAEVKKSINVLVNSNESLQNRIRIKDEEVLMLTKEAQDNRHNEALLKHRNMNAKAKIDVLEAKLLDIALIAYSACDPKNPNNPFTQKEQEFNHNQLEEKEQSNVKTITG